MKIEASVAHTTRWYGTLSGEQLRKLLRDALVRELCPHKDHGTILRVDCPDLGFVDRLPEIAFELDHDWYLKRDDDAEPPAAADQMS